MHLWDHLFGNVIVSGMQPKIYVAYVDHILHRDRFWATSIASGSVRLWDLRSCCMVLGVLVVASSPLEGELTGSSWCLHYRLCAQYAPKRVRRRDCDHLLSI